MKKILLSCAVVLLLTACSGNSEWEYKVVKIAGNQGASGNFGAMSYNDPTSQLNKLGEEGWEIVSSYTEISTVHPNFGNKEYVTGIQPNTRTSVVNIVLKRKK